MYLNLKSLILFVKISVLKFICFLSFISLSVIGLSGCGGGGSGDSTPTASIDSYNATEIVRVAASAVFETDEIGEFGDFFYFTSSVERSNPDVMVAASRIAISRLDNATVKSIQIPEETSQCAGGGSVTISGSIAGTDTLTKGDVIQIDADMCNDGYGEIVDGQMKMTITSLDGDLSTSELFLLGVKVDFTEFSVTDSSEETVFNGDIGITLDTRTPSVMQMTVSGNSFTVSSMGQTQSISNFSNGYTVNSSESPFTWMYDSKGTVISSEFIGSVNYQMPVNFEGLGEYYPHTGELLVTGADSATLRLITIDDIDIQIEADYDGDGDVDVTFNMTWAELLME